MSVLVTIGIVVGIGGGTLGLIEFLLGEKRDRGRTKADQAEARLLLPLVEREKADRLRDNDNRERLEHQLLVGDFNSRGMLHSSYFNEQERILRERFEHERHAIDREYDPTIARLRATIGDDD